MSWTCLDSHWQLLPVQVIVSIVGAPRRFVASKKLELISQLLAFIAPVSSGIGSTAGRVGS